jgi:hypothetical protein
MSTIKGMLVIFLNHEGMFHKEFVCPNQTANQYLCHETVQHLRKQARCQYLEQWSNQTH